MLTRSIFNFLDPEQLLQKFCGELYDAIQSPTGLAHHLYAKRFISSNTLQEVSEMKFSQGKSTLLGRVMAYIRISKKKTQDINKFINCLELTKTPGLKMVAKEMRQFCLSEPTVVEYTC